MSFIRPGKGGADPKERALWGEMLSLGMVFPIAILLGWFIGKWVGTRMGHPEAGSIVGLIWGIAAGFYELYKVTVRMNKQKKIDPDNSPKDGQNDHDQDPGRP